MKNSVLFITLIFIFLLSATSLKSQDMFTVLEGKLSPDEEEIVESAKTSIMDGNRMVSVANDAYNKNSKLFNSKKKSKRKKAEKKTIQAKKNLTSAASYFDSGYDKLYNLYLEKLQSYTFEFPNDKQQVNNLISTAESSFNSGQKTLASHKSYTEKQFKKDIKYQSLKGSIEKGGNSQKDAVNYLVDAIVIYLAQDEKKQNKIDSDNEAWADAQRNNTESGYNNYLNNYPDGLHANDARNGITKLKEEEMLADQKTDVFFSIQIAATKKPLNEYQMGQILPYGVQGPITSNIVETDSHPYKYLIGDFSTYEDARSYEKDISTKETRYFIVAFKDNERVTNITSVCNPADHPQVDPIR